MEQIFEYECLSVKQFLIAGEFYGAPDTENDSESTDASEELPVPMKKELHIMLQQLNTKTVAKSSVCFNFLEGTPEYDYALEHYAEGRKYVITVQDGAWAGYNG